MEIKYKKNEGVIVSSAADVGVLISRVDAYKGDDYDIVFSKKFKGEGFHIEIPGEYEIGEISIIAQSSSISQEVDVIEFVVDDISVVYISSKFKYSKTIHDNLGQVHVLISDVIEPKSFEDFLLKFDPEIFIPLGDEAIVEEMVKNTSLTNVEQKSKIKIKPDQLGTDGFILETNIIDR